MDKTKQEIERLEERVEKLLKKGIATQGVKEAFY